MRLTLGLVLLGAACFVPSLPAATGSGPSSWVGDLTPIAPGDWNFERAAYLLERAGFGGTPEEIQALAALTPQEAVRRLVYYQKVQDVDLPPFQETGIYPSKSWNRGPNVQAFSAILFGSLDKLPPEQRAAMMQPARTGVTPEDARIARTDKQAVVDKFYYWNAADGRELARADNWLVDRILNTRRPLQEKLVLFWHGHFASGNEKVRDYRKMLAQFQMFREHGNGNLRDLLIGIGQDPAMLIYLDNRQNLKGHPNENFAREILELFSLGVGNYTEKDIKEAARAFTGWTFDDTGSGFMNRPNLHDTGSKTFLGKTGNFSGEDIVDVILQQPAAPHFIARKLYKYFVRENPSKELEDQLAASFAGNKFEIAPFLEQVFLSRDFYSPASYGTQIKSPVQLVISTYKELGLKRCPTYPSFAALTAELGQAVFYPPNVKGWDGGRTWINPATVFERENVARYILFPEEMPVIKDAHLQGSRRLSGDVIHEQFLAEAEKGDFTSFPSAGTAGKMTMGVMSAPGAGVAAPGPKVVATGAGIASTPDVMKGGGAGSETSKMSGEDFNLFRGVFNAAVEAYAAVPPAPRKVADFQLAKMMQQEGVKDANGAVDSMLRRFVRLPITGERHQALVSFFEKQIGGTKIDYTRYSLEKELRELAHLIMSAPEYQLS